MKKSAITLKVEKDLYALQKKRKQMPYFPSGYIVGKSQCSLEFADLQAPLIRGYYKTTDLEFADVHKIWFESNLFEAKCICLYWLEDQPTEFLIKNHKKIISWAKLIDNWASADGYCSILSRMFEKNPFLLIETYQKWNNHKSTWYRRLSLIGLFFYSRMRTVQPPLHLAQKFIINNFDIKEYYLQKAVGWTIREMYNAYPKEGLQFITENIEKISPDAWYAASEKLKPVEKKRLLALRKKMKSENKKN